MTGYEDIEDTSETTGPTGGEGPAPPKEGVTEEGETALIPKSLLMGKEVKVGETIPMKVVHIFEDEVEVQCSPYKEGAESSQGMEGPTPEEQLEKLAVPA